MKKILFTIIILVIILLGSCFKTNKDNSQEDIILEEKENDVNTDTSVAAYLTIDEVISTNGEGISYKTDSFYVIEDVVQPGQAISHILKDYNVSSSDIYKLVQASEGVFDAKKFQKDHRYTIICSKDSNKIAKCFVYQKSKTEYVVFDFRDSIRVYEGEKKVIVINNTVSGTIKQGGGLSVSLSKKLGKVKASPLVDILANNIYAWSIDFFQIQAKDSFIVHFEERYVGNQYIGIGKIHAASFTHKGSVINAFRFKENENYVDYFDEKGNNLRSEFLKSPIDFARISSGFGNRKHPISGKWKQHNGTDYAAKKGTPIMVTADGTFDFSGWKRGYGNCVIVTHTDNYSTLYAHMSKFQPGIRKGSYVRQTDIIGYVGSTGYAKGDHLHYEFRIFWR